MNQKHVAAEERVLPLPAMIGTADVFTAARPAAGPEDSRLLSSCTCLLMMRCLSQRL